MRNQVAYYTLVAALSSRKHLFRYLKCSVYLAKLSTTKTSIQGQWIPLLQPQINTVEPAEVYWLPRGMTSLLLALLKIKSLVCTGWVVIFQCVLVLSNKAPKCFNNSSLWSHWKAYFGLLLIPKTNIQALHKYCPQYYSWRFCWLSTWVLEESQDVQSVSSFVVQLPESKPGPARRKK